MQRMRAGFHEGWGRRAFVSPPGVRRPTLDSAKILELLLERRPTYTLSEAKRLAQITQRTLDKALEDGAVEPVRDGGAICLLWYDVVSLAVAQWTPGRIAEVTRHAGHADALPPLNQHCRITVELPVYQLRLLHYLAERRSTSDAPPLAVSDILEYALSELAFSENPRAIDRHLPGLSAAVSFPSLESWTHAGPADGCLFCGAGTPEPPLCDACTKRHVPPHEE